MRSSARASRGAKAAEALRSRGFEGDIVLIGEERWRPYERPPLSKWYLQEHAEREDGSSTPSPSPPSATLGCIMTTGCVCGPARRLGGSAAEPVRLAGGDELPADLVVVGMDPNTELAEAAGRRLAGDGGMVCDEYLRTHAQRIWACGDAASAWHPLCERHLRVEHWANALSQPQACAGGMLGEASCRTPAPTGTTPRWSTSATARSRAAVTWARSRSPRSTCGETATPAGRHDDLEPAKALIAARATPGPKALADPEVALASLAGQ